MPAGRPFGSKKVKDAERARMAAAKYGWPIEVMLAEMAELWKEAQALRAKPEATAEDLGRAKAVAREAAALARDAAPYLHPRLTATTISGDEDNPLLPKPDDRELARRIALILSRADRKGA